MNHYDIPTFKEEEQGVKCFMDENIYPIEEMIEIPLTDYVVHYSNVLRFIKWLDLSEDQEKELTSELIGIVQTKQLQK